MSGDGQGPEPSGDSTVHKVVVRMQDGSVVKGYFPSPDPLRTISASANFLQRFMQHGTGFAGHDHGRPDGLQWPEVKAVFFVSTFEGDRDLEKLHFYGDGPEIKTIWIEITFRDGEVVEGYVKNTLPKLEEGGFFLRPSSPESNNLLAFVNLAAVVQFRVLGVSTADCC